MVLDENGGRREEKMEATWTYAVRAVIAEKRTAITTRTGRRHHPSSQWETMMTA